jgi:hypothetical protein
VSDSRSCRSPVRIVSERRTATTTRWASTTSLVSERASRCPTSGPSSKATTTTDWRNFARRAGRAPSRHTLAMTGCVVVSGVSWRRAAVRNSWTARSPRSTEMRNPASRIKVVAVAHGGDRSLVDRACLVFPICEEIGERGVPSGFGGEEVKPGAKCVRSATVDLGQLVERVLLVGVEPDGRRRHVSSVARTCYGWSGSRSVREGGTSKSVVHVLNLCAEMVGPERGGGPTHARQFTWDPGGGWPLGRQAGPPGEFPPTPADRPSPQLVPAVSTVTSGV